MERITKLARISVTRAWGFCGLAILMVMMGTASHPPYCFTFGALGCGITGLVMAWYGLTYHHRRRVEDTEVWMLLPPEDRPSKAVALPLIATAMRDELLEKAWYSARLCGLFLVLAGALQGVRLVLGPAG
ncbi:MAG: hypothetical protein C0457_00415 [Polymorphum sp.]|nr:hypothetical protein [Polymorphum sp.]